MGVDDVAPSERRTPAVIIKRAGEMVHVAGAVALGAVVGVVVVQLALVRPKPLFCVRSTGVLL